MKPFVQYWAATMLRGVAAIVAGTAVLLVPEMIATALLMPFAILLSILCLAAYGIIDSAILLGTSFILPKGVHGRLILRAQGICGAAVGVLLFALVSGHVQLSWFLYLAAFQAITTASAEFYVARGAPSHGAAHWSYASAAISAISATALLMGGQLQQTQLAWLLFGYLGVFGLTQLLLSIRMLVAEHDLVRKTDFEDLGREIGKPIRLQDVKG